MNLPELVRALDTLTRALTPGTQENRIANAIASIRPECRVMDDEDDPESGVCDRPAGHPGVIHSEYRDGKLWAEWRSILPGDEQIKAST